MQSPLRLNTQLRLWTRCPHWVLNRILCDECDDRRWYWTCRSFRSSSSRSWWCSPSTSPTRRRCIPSVREWVSDTFDTSNSCAGLTDKNSLLKFEDSMAGKRLTSEERRRKTDWSAGNLPALTASRYLTMLLMRMFNILMALCMEDKWLVTARRERGWVREWHVSNWVLQLLTHRLTARTAHTRHVIDSDTFSLACLDLVLHLGESAASG